MAASLLTGETVTLHNLPYVRDIITQRRLLEDLGATVLTPELRSHKITASNIELFEAPYELVRTMRASVLALGPLLARFGKAKVSLPGGCAIGTRPIDLHLAAFEKLGAQVRLESGNVIARAPKGRRLIGGIFPHHAEHVAREMRVLSPADQAELGRLCRQLGRAGREGREKEATSGATAHPLRLAPAL